MMPLLFDAFANNNGSKPPILVPEPPETPGEQEVMLSWAILILISLLFMILLTSYYLQLRKIRFIHETVVSIFLGIVVGLAIRLSDSKALQDMVTFDHKYFFNLLLPPIILNCGYDMKRKHFFRNFGTILTFAFAGTMISTLVIGLLIYLIVLTGIHGLELTFLDCIVFGAILSSTDPVTVLAIFHQMRVDPKLYAIIFGESILNDSVAIVLFATLGQFQDKEVSFGNLVHGVVSFLGSFFGSVMIGVILALICSLMLKHSYLHRFPSLESCLISLLAYSSYLLSNGIKLSGIVSLLFCGIIMKHYAYDSMSVRSRLTTKYMFRVLSQMSENFIFIYLGVTLFTKADAVYLPSFIFLTLAIILFARYASTAPLAALINAISRRANPHREQDQIPKNHAIMLWWAGLRGAIAFALSFDITGPSGPALRTTTLVVCVLTVIGLGGTTNWALEKLKIRVGVGAAHGAAGRRRSGYDDDDDEYGDDLLPTPPVGDDDDEDEDEESSEDDVEDWDDDLPGSNPELSLERRAPRRSGEIDRRTSQDGASTADATSPATRVQIDPPARRRRQETQSQADMTHWFMSFDNVWLKPLFTRSRYGVGTYAYRRQSGVSGASSPTRQSLLGAPTTRAGPLRRKSGEPNIAAGGRGVSSRGFGKSTGVVSPTNVGGGAGMATSGRVGSLSAPVTRAGRGTDDGEEERFVGADGKTWARPVIGGGSGSRTRVSSNGVELVTKSKREQS